MLKIRRWRRPRQTGRSVVNFWKLSKTWQHFEISLQHGSFCCTTVCSGSLCVVFLWFFMVIFLQLFSLLGLVCDWCVWDCVCLKALADRLVWWGLQQQHNWLPCEKTAGTDFLLQGWTSDLFCCSNNLPILPNRISRLNSFVLGIFSALPKLRCLLRILSSCFCQH